MYPSKFEHFPVLATGPDLGAPHETLYSRRPEFRPTYASVRHLIEAGILFQLFGDYEATGADKELDKPKDGAFLVFDLPGRLVAKKFVPMSIAPAEVYSIGASLVGNVWPENFDKGYPAFMAAGMVQDIFARGSRVDGKALGLPEINLNGKKGFLYSLEFPDARIDLEVQEEGKKFRLRGETTWRKVYAAWHPFNGESYDDFLTSHWFASVGSAHLFHSSRKSHNMVRTDTRSALMWLWAFGEQGNEGFVLPSRHHNKTKSDVLSTKLGDCVRYHSPDANRKRGIDDGIHYYDGRVFDAKRMHGSPEDTAATAALYFYMRRRFPDELRIIENLSDEHEQKRFLQGSANFGNRPLMGFYYYDQGMLTRRIGVMLTTGDKYGQISRNEVSFLNLSSYDPAELRPKSDGEIRAMIVRRDDPLLVHHRTNRTPKFADFDRAYAAGVGNELTPDALDARRMSLVNAQDEIQRIAGLAHDIRVPKRPYNVQTPRPLEEDDYRHYGDPEYIPLRDPVTGREIAREPMDVYKRRWKKWKLEQQIDETLNAATQGHGTDYSDELVALEARQKIHDTTAKQLAKETSGWRYPVALPSAPHDLSSADEARKHDWHMRWETRDMRFCNTPDCWIMNERGQRLPWQLLLSTPFETRNKLWPKPHIGEDFTTGPHLRVAFDRDEERYPIISTRIAFSADDFYRKYETPEWLNWWMPFFEERWGQHRDWYDAYITLSVQGPPNLPPLQHPVMTQARKLAEIIAMKDGAAGSTHSDYVRMVLSQPQGQRLLAANEADARRRLREYRWTPERLRMMGYDPLTRSPLLVASFVVDRDRAVRLIVPDVMLDHPRWHAQWHQHLVLAHPGKRVYARLEKLVTIGDPLLLVGERTNRIRLAARPTCAVLPDGIDAANAIKASVSAYATVGKKIGPQPFILTFQQLAPIHNESNSPAKQQMVAVSDLDWAALVDPGAGSMKSLGATLTTLIIRDLDLNASYEFKGGAIRLRRKLGGVETGDEFRGVVLSAKRLKVEDLANFSDEEARRAGHSTADNLYSAWKRVFADISTRDPQQQKLWRIDLKPVDKETYAYIKPEDLPVARYAPRLPVPANSNHRVATKEIA